MFPLSGNPARTLCTLAGLEREGDEAWYWTLTRHFDTANTIRRYADAYPWSAVRARERVLKLMMERQGGVIVAVGRKAADALEIPRKHLWGEWMLAGAYQLNVIPHPSGLNRIMNEKAMRDLTGRVLREAMDRAESWRTNG